MDDLNSPLNALKTVKELETIKKPSSLDLALSRGLNQVSLLYKTTLEPAEVRLWQSCFEGERAEMIEWGFAEYFKTGTFPPKPAEITALIRQRREAVNAETYHATPQSEWEAAQKDRAKYFASPEYKAFLKKMDDEHGMGTGTAVMDVKHTKEELLAQAERLGRR